MTMRVSKDRIDMDDKVLQKPVIKDYGESVVSANSSTAYTIDLTQGNVFYITLTGNCAFTFSNPSPTGNSCTFTLVLVQDSTGSRTVTWPTAVRWPSGTAPTLTTTKARGDIFTFASVNAGTTWYGTLSAQNYDTYIPLYLPYGYLGGGSGPVSTMDRIDYSNDTATATLKGSLTAARYYMAATGTSSYGYFGAGVVLPATAKSTVDRLDYSNDSAATVAKGPLSLARYRPGATGTSSFGYFAGGQAPARSTIDRIDYSNDTATAVAKGPLSASRYEMGATGTSLYGYFGGGYLAPAPGQRSIVDRTDYSNDTATAVIKGPLSAARYYLTAVGNSSYGYFGGGDIPASAFMSTIDRVDYSNDTTAAISKGKLALARRILAASGNSSYGYFAGGYGLTAPGARSTVDRFDYSNDTANAVGKGPLALARYGSGATQDNPL